MRLLRLATPTAKRVPSVRTQELDTTLGIHSNDFSLAGNLANARHPFSALESLQCALPRFRHREEQSIIVAAVKRQFDGVLFFRARDARYPNEGKARDIDTCSNATGFAKAGNIGGKTI